MKRKVLVSWTEYHEQEIEADLETDEVLMIANVNIEAPTYKSCAFRSAMIMGPVEREFEREAS